MATVYTHAVFKKFQIEVLGVVACHPKSERKDGTTATFKVQDFEENQGFSVTWNEETSDASCACRLFEYNGFLCRHVMIVLQISGVNNIPVKYILKRWTKDAKTREAIKQVDSIETRNQRYDKLCQRACKLGDEGSLCQETYSIAFTALEEALKKCERINSSVGPLLGDSSNLHGLGEVNTKKESIISRKEKEATSTGVHCWDQMGDLTFRASAVDCSYGSQENDQLNTSAQCYDDGYGDQAHIQGQLRSTVPSSERLHQMGQMHFRSQNVQNSLLIQPNVHNQQFKTMER